MEEVIVKNYQELAMRTCLPSARNIEYYRCLIVSELGEAIGNGQVPLVAATAFNILKREFEEDRI